LIVVADETLELAIVPRVCVARSLSATEHW
jgi:hypothetical protein